MKHVFILLFSLGFSIIANAAPMTVLLPLGFENTTVDSNGVVSDTDNSMKLQGGFGPEIKASAQTPLPQTPSVFYADIEGRKFRSQPHMVEPSSVYNRSVETIRNANGVVQSVVFSSSGSYDVPGQKNTRPTSTEFVRFGKDSKVLSQTQCWNGANCFTITSGLCKSLPTFAGVKDLAELYDKVDSCQKLSQSFDRAIDQQGPAYAQEHLANLKDLEASETVSKEAGGLLQQLKEKYIQTDSEKVKNRTLKSIVDSHEMRIYDLVKSCMFYENQKAFDESNKALATPGTQSFFGQGVP